MSSKRNENQRHCHIICHWEPKYKRVALILLIFKCQNGELLNVAILTENSVAGEVFLIEMLSLLYIVSVKSLNAIQPLIIELSLKKIFYLFSVANIAVLYAQTNLKRLRNVSLMKIINSEYLYVCSVCFGY